MGEANLPAQKTQAHADARIPCPDVDPGRPGRDQGAPVEGPSSPHRLIWRISDRATFAALAGTRRRRSGPLSLAYLSGEPALPPRVAYSVGRRVGPAVVRNRLRRRLRASVAAHRDRLAPGGAYLISASPAAAGASFAQLDAAVADLVGAPPGR